MTGSARIVGLLSKGLFGGRNIHRAPFLIPWPQYSPDEDLHADVVEAAAHAEGVVDTVDGQTGDISAARNRVRAALDADARPTSREVAK